MFRVLQTASVLVLMAFSMSLTSTHATTYQTISDLDLLAQSPVVLVGRGEAPVLRPDLERPVTRYAVEVERVVKGQVSRPRIEVESPGGTVGDGPTLFVFGAPRFVPGERVLLFLERRPDGAYGIVHLMLGAFYEIEVGDERLAMRDLSGATDHSGADGETAERDFERFVDWLEEAERGSAPEPDYFVAIEDSERVALRPRFNLMSSGGNKVRWFAFDGGGSVDWRLDEDGADGSGGSPPLGKSEMDGARAAWNADGTSTISYSYAGTTSSTNGFAGGTDGINAFIFGDPNGEVSGSFSCSSGGVLMIAGWWSSGTATYNGETHAVIVEGDGVVNDGTECLWASPSTLDEAAQMFTHEFGHTLGIAHSCGDSGDPCSEATAAEREATMRASLHGDGRGAALRSDDSAAAQCLYGDGATCDGSGDEPVPPSAPSNLSATAESSSRIQLDWSDNSSDEDEFRVEIATTGGFSPLGTVGANVTSVIVSGLEAETTYTFRVRACNLEGCSEYSNEASATTFAAAVSPPSAPTALEATALSDSEIRLDWNDTSSDEEEFRIERRTTGSFGQIAVVGPGVESAVIDGLMAETTYTFRVRACNSGGCSEYSNEASATTEGVGEEPPDEPPDPPTDPPPAQPRGVSAETLSSTEIRLTWRDRSEDEDHFVVEQRSVGEGDFREVAEVERNDRDHVVEGLMPETTYVFRVRARNENGDSEPSNEVIATTLSATACPVDEHVACLHRGRFQVEVEFTTSGGESGRAVKMPLTTSSTLFYFFDENNMEMLLKVLDGCRVPGLENYWVFYSATTNVGFELTVKDTDAGVARTYRNPVDEPAAPVTDTSAFDTCP